MVPTFGMFDFLPIHLANIEAEEAERDGYLAEVRRNSTEFGFGNVNEAETVRREAKRRD